MKEKVRKKLAIWRKDRWLVRAGIACGALVAALLIGLCISICMQVNMHQRYAAARQGMQEQLYRNLDEMVQLYGRIDEPGVDVQNKLLPEMRAQYFAAAALNSALGEHYGAASAVLTQEQTAALEEAFAQYSAAYRQGSSTDLAQADMNACIGDIREMVDGRYHPTQEPTPTVPVIDGASGALATEGEAEGE